ncbi:hypothetical protein [Streptomyces heilongjiangensis]|uniref:Uncharacterized protein n=1 Tax=Streptomyces heilongjiangensis TaxID=945052 RepID=A0ABW1B3F0_9ACTN|nr:hypothetical protein [Streptomyces heilongjiangensis]MDC2948684.1 hypothetical protein [Streptomyces heilongjiangensis]
MDEKREALVLVEDGDWETVIVALRALGPVTQLLPPRLALVALPADPRMQAPELPGTAWYEDDLPQRVYDRLSEQEQLFVNAWKVRRTPKQRPGNHLTWDAPGRIPPDWPRSDRP